MGTVKVTLLIGLTCAVIKRYKKKILILHSLFPIALLINVCNHDLPVNSAASKPVT